MLYMLAKLCIIFCSVFFSILSPEMQLQTAQVDVIADNDGAVAASLCNRYGQWIRKCDVFGCSAPYFNHSAMSGLQAGCFGTWFRRKQVSVSKQSLETPSQESHSQVTSSPIVGSLTPGKLKCHYSTTCDHSYTNASNCLEIHDHPEVAFSEIFAHDILTSFMASHGFTVTKSYLGLDTAFRAEFTHGKGGRVLGVNAEYDALKGLGHACGHSLIAASGCGVALAVKAALEAHDIPGKVVLLGTPAEEGGGGKVILLERGGYKDMDLCVMCHPSPGPTNSANIGTSIAAQDIEVEYAGRSAHAGAAPWEGTNALDAAFLAYGSISVLRQQMRPDHRIHGIIEGNQDWAPNVIPDYAKMHWLVRAPTSNDLSAFVERVKHCFQAAALATGCEIKIKLAKPYFDLNQNPVLGQEFTDVVMRRYSMVTTGTAGSASTDFGNVSYALPALHPGYAIPTELNGGNHTIGFTKAAATQEAHVATMLVTKGLAHTGFRALHDDDFFKQVKASFKS
ncbi:amidohydrolase [Mycena crocata]|nr:amidohydrolase [Mycena crocata]